MIIAVTESNNVYALDAADGSVIWQRNVGPPVPLAKLPCGDIDPLGITGTPVVDLPSRTLLFDAMTTPDNGTTVKHLIYSMNVDTGTTNSGWPVDVNATARLRKPGLHLLHAERAGRAGGPGRHRLCALRRPLRRLRHLLRLAGRRAAEQSRQCDGVGHSGARRGHVGRRRRRQRRRQPVHRHRQHLRRERRGAAARRSSASSPARSSAA